MADAAWDGSPNSQPGLVGAVLVAAGRSTRMGFDKLWASLGDRPVLAWSVDVLAESALVDRLVVVTVEHRLGEARRLTAGRTVPTHVVVGGERRRDSVAAGLDALGGCEWVV